MARDDDDDMTGLSEAEIAALEDGDDGEDADILDKIAGDDDDDDAGDNAADSASADAAQDHGADDDEGEADEPAEFQPQYVAPSVEGYDEKMAAFAEEKKALRAQLNEGVIDMDAYEEAKDVLAAKESDLKLQQFRAQTSAEQNQQIAVQKWQWEQEQFFGEEKNGIYQDKMLSAALDYQVKTLANDPANASRSGKWFLSEADRLVRERFGSGEKPSPKKEASRKPDLSGIPKTLGNLPNAEIPETGSDEFGHLEKLDGMALERALTKLSPEQQARYLGAA